MQPHRAPAARCPRVPVPPLAPGLLPRDSPRGFTTCRAPAGEGEPVGAGEPPRTRGAGPDTCAGYNLATSLGGHHDPCAAPQGQAWDPQASTHLAFPSVRPSPSICPVSAPWRTWTTSVQNTLGQSGEGGANGTHRLARREQVTGWNSIHRAPWLQRSDGFPARPQLPPPPDLNSRSTQAGPSPSFPTDAASPHWETPEDPGFLQPRAACPAQTGPGPWP